MVHTNPLDFAAAAKTVRNLILFGFIFLQNMKDTKCFSKDFPSLFIIVRFRPLVLLLQTAHYFLSKEVCTSIFLKVFRFLSRFACTFMALLKYFISKDSIFNCYFVNHDYHRHCLSIQQQSIRM